MQTIIVTKHLDSNSKHLEVLLRYYVMEGVRNEKEEIFLTSYSNLFALGTITLPK
jgi:hypothetical protein